MEMYVVKVKYYNETIGQFNGREYTYFSEEALAPGDNVRVPFRDSFAEAQVTAVDIPEAEIESFRDKVKTIPAGSIISKMAPDIKSDFRSPEPLSDEAREIITAGRDTMIADATEPFDIFKDSTLSSEDEPIVISRAAPIGTALINIAPAKDQAIQAIYQEALALLRNAAKRVVKTTEDIKLATEDLALVKKLKKAIEEKRKEYVTPIRQHLDDVNTAFKSLLAPLEEADRITGSQIKEYWADQERRRREQEEINRLRIEAAEKEAALKDGEISEPVSLVEVAPEVTKKIHTGTRQRRDAGPLDIRGGGLCRPAKRV